MPDMNSAESQQGNYSLDKNYSFIGSRCKEPLSTKIPSKNLVDIGELTYDQAAFIEPITVCLHPIMRLDNLR